MAVHKIPIDRLTPETLQGVIEEFVSREGTDYGAVEASRETKIGQVRSKLEKGSALLFFDDETETTQILLAHDPVLKKLAGETGRDDIDP